MFVKIQFFVIIQFFLITYYYPGALSIRLFSHGRRFDGNLGDPSKHQTLNSDLLPPDQWFQQNLDHFDPTNSKTWKQVWSFVWKTLYYNFAKKK